jgi:hypothetical protein
MALHALDGRPVAINQVHDSPAALLRSMPCKCGLCRNRYAGCRTRASGHPLVRIALRPIWRTIAVMNRRRFLLGLAGGSAALVGGASPQNGPAMARIGVDYEAAGRAIAPDFVGLSYESAVVAGNDFFTADNRMLLRLLRTLGPKGVLRIGGNTSERTRWTTQDTAAPKETFLITPPTIDRLAGFVRALGWQLIYGLNLATGTPEQAAAEAVYVARAVGPLLLAFQIGNEPDGFGRWSDVRPKTYDVAAFLSEWRRFHAAIRAAVPDAPFAGPDVAAETGWIAPFADAAPTGLVMLTRHYYADGPASNPAVTLGKLMRSAGQIVPVLAELAAIGTAHRLPWRIAETNSIYAGGRPGVSDTLGAALWGAELMFQIATAGGVGVNFHAGEDKIYTPISHGRGGGLTARALYYGMLMFAQATGDLVPTRLDSGGVPLAAYAVRATDGTLRLVVINKDSRAVSARIEPGRRFANGGVWRLTGPGLDATADDYGGWAPTAREEARFDAGAIVLDLPGASAALIALRAG